MRFLAIFLSFVPWIDLKMHTLVLLNDLDTWAVMSLMLDHSEITKMPFWDDPKSQKCFIFTIFWSLLCWIDLILHILILLNELDTLAVKSPLLDHSKIKKMPSWMIQRAKNSQNRSIHQVIQSEASLSKFFEVSKWLNLQS